MREREIITTSFDKGKLEDIGIYSGLTRDQVIIIREAVLALRSDAARECEISVSGVDGLGKAWALMVKARK